jgi:hypothetical protein
MLIALALCTVMFLMHESRMKSPFVNLKLFRIRRFSFSVASLLIVSICYSLTGFLMPFYLQDVLRLSATQVGLLFMAPSVLTVALAPLSGYLTDRFGPRIPDHRSSADDRIARQWRAAASRLPLAPSRYADHRRRHDKRYFQSGEFHGDD